MEHSPLLKHAGRIYTPITFDLFQNEFDWSFAAYIVSRNETDQMCQYVVAIFNKDGEYKVICCMFKTMGLLCCCILKVLNVWDVKEIPNQYIMKRWTREASVHDTMESCSR